MSDADLYSTWTIALVLAGVVVLIAAGLLIGVWMAARRVAKLAVVALSVVEQIKANTASVWALQSTNEVAVGLLDEANSILTHAGGVAHALHEAGAAGASDTEVHP